MAEYFMDLSNVSINAKKIVYVNLKNRFTPNRINRNDWTKSVWISGPPTTFSKSRYIDLWHDSNQSILSTTKCEKWFLEELNTSRVHRSEWFLVRIARVRAFEVLFRRLNNSVQ